MPKTRIEKLLAEAGQYKAANPETPLTMFEIAALSLLGADASVGAPAEPEREPFAMDEFRAAVARMGEPFTASDLAAEVFARHLPPGKKPTRRQIRAAAAAARIITGRLARKSNGRDLYDASHHLTPLTPDRPLA